MGFYPSKKGGMTLLASISHNFTAGTAESDRNDTLSIDISDYDFIFLRVGIFTSSADDPYVSSMDPVFHKVSHVIRPQARYADETTAGTSTRYLMGGYIYNNDILTTVTIAARWHNNQKLTTEVYGIKV